MGVRFTAAEVQAIAALAQLELTPDEVDLFARQLGEFLGYAAEVQAVDTTGVTPTTCVASSQGADRPDELSPSLERDAALGNAPDPARDAGLFRVPRVLG
jgi:aspartyl-tRNA(Asn)/glutamyl-tRNA(Gln) amidotransferase subunit C